MPNEQNFCAEKKKNSAPCEKNSLARAYSYLNCWLFKVHTFYSGVVWRPFCPRSTSSHGLIPQSTWSFWACLFTSPRPMRHRSLLTWTNTSTLLMKPTMPIWPSLPRVSISFGSYRVFKKNGDSSFALEINIWNWNVYFSEVKMKV